MSTDTTKNTDRPSADEPALVELIGMGADNHARLMRVCPDDELRLRVLQARANRVVARAVLRTASAITPLARQSTEVFERIAQQAGQAAEVIAQSWPQLVELMRQAGTVEAGAVERRQEGAAHAASTDRSRAEADVDRRVP